MEEEKKLYPMLFVPIEDEEAHATVQLADLGYQDSEVSNGYLAADCISDVMETYLDRVVGDDVFSYYGRQFPVTVRTFNITGGRTPLLVCPDDELAEERFDFLGKAKLWRVLSVGKGARLALGFKRSVEPAEFYKGCQDGSVGDMLNYVEPHEGEYYLVYPGLVHCMAGTLSVLEIAESSPMDFRLYGWGSKGSEEEDSLTLEAAFDFIEYGKYRPYELKKSEGQIVSLDQFVVNERRVVDPLRITVGSGDGFALYSCISGEAAIQDTIVLPGQTVLVPADLSEFHVVARRSGTVLLETMVPPRPHRDSYTGEVSEISHIDLPDFGQGPDDDVDDSEYAS